MSNPSFHRWGSDLLKVMQLNGTQVRLEKLEFFLPGFLEFPGLCPHLLFFLQRFGAVLEALEKGQPVDLSAMPPAPEGQHGDGGGTSQDWGWVWGRVSGLGLAWQSYLHLCSGAFRLEAPPTGL